MPLPAPYAPPWKRLGEDLVATLAWLRLKVQEGARRNGEGSLPVPGFWPRRWPQLFWPLVLAAFLLASAGLVFWVQHRPAVEVPSPTREPSMEPLKEAGELALPPPLEVLPESESTTSTDELKERDGEAPEETGQPENLGEPMAEDQPQLPPTDNSTPTPNTIDEAEQLLAEWSAGDPEGLLVVIRPDPANATLTLQPSGTFLSLPAADRLRQAERWQARATEWGYSHLELVDGAGRLVGREALVGEGMILLEAADAGGSPATDGEVGNRDGMFGNRAAGTGGALGGTPDARRGRWAGLLGHQRRGADSGAHGGVHRQPQAAAG